MKKKSQIKKERNNGITLIALVITIIVLLILAAVSIATLTGENGILSQATKAGEANNKAEAEEQVKMAVMGSYGTDGKIDKKELETNLKQIPGIKGVPSPIEELPITVEVNGYEVEIQDDGGVERQEEETGGETYNPEELTIGVETAINTEKYGWKVKKYDVKTKEFTTGVWRLFYQDTKYTYLIADELVGSYKPSEYYDKEEDKDKYSDGTKMSIEGQKLNGRVSSLFTAEDTKENENIRATVWFTDTDYWSEYKNGDAAFSIASPTAELFEASYNKNTSSNHSTYKKGDISVTLGTNGYDENTSANWLKKEDSHGIYNKDELSDWWLASPQFYDSGRCLYVYGGGRLFRPPQRELQL